MAGFEITDDQIDFAKYMMPPEDRHRIVSAPTVLDGLCELSFGKRAYEGLTLPWRKHESLVRFPPKKVSLWGGYTHHGKTQVLKQLMLHAAAQGQVCVIASMEEEPEETLFDMACMALMTQTPGRDDLDVFTHWARNRIYVYDQQQMVSPERIIGVMHYAATELKASHFVIDSLMRLDLEGDDYERQRVFGNLLGQHTKLANLHTHLVAHVRKGQDDSKPPGLYDVKGAADLINQVDKIFTVWRNKVPYTERDEKKHYMCDGVLTCDKQRGRPNWVGKLRLYYHARTGQLLAERTDDPREFIKGYTAPQQTNDWVEERHG